MSYKNREKPYKKVDYKHVPKHNGESDKPLSYVPMSNVILRCDTAKVLATGEEFEITPDFKIVYTYMRERYLFNKLNNNPYYESWESVAAILGKSREIFKTKKDHKPTIKDVMLSLGLMKILDEKTRRSFHKEVYDVSETLGEVVFSNKKASDYKQRIEDSEKEYHKYKQKQEIKETQVEDIQDDLFGYEEEDWDEVPF